MAINQYASIDLNRLKEIIEKFQYSVTDASKMVQDLSGKYTKNFQTSLITALNEKLKNPTVIIREMEKSGLRDGQRFLDQQRALQQLLSDQKNAFTDFSIALQQLSSKFESQNIFAQNQSYKDTATALGLSVGDVAFNRFMGRYNNVSEARADHNAEIIKPLYDKRHDANALVQDDWIGALSKVKGNEGLIQHLQFAKDFKEFLLLLMQAGAIAQQANDQNALAHTKKFFNGDAGSIGMYTSTAAYVPTSEQIAKSRTSEGTNLNDPVMTSLNDANNFELVSESTNQAQKAIVTNRNRLDVANLQAGSIRDPGVANQYNALTETMINNPGYTAMVVAGLQYAKQVETVIGSMTGAGGAASDLGASLAGLAEKLGEAGPYVLGAVGTIGGGTVLALGAQQLSGKRDAIVPKPTAKEQDEAYKVAVDDINDPRNKFTMAYLKKQGIDVQYNKEMMRFDLLRNGKVVGNIGRRLDELYKNVYALRNDPDRVRELERASGGKVKINEQTGKTALYYGGRFVSDVDLNGWKTGGVIASDLEGGIFGGGPLANVKAQILAEERVRRHNLSAGKNAQTLDAFNHQGNTPNVAPLPLLPTTGQKIPSQVDIKEFHEKNKTGNSPVNLTPMQQNYAKNRTTAHDLQVAKACSHVENSNNSYKYDVHITVNSPSGDPAQIAREVSEQLRNQTRRDAFGMSKHSIQALKTGH